MDVGLNKRIDKAVNHTHKTDQVSVGEQSCDYTYQDRCIQGLYFQHSPPQQQDPGLNIPQNTTNYTFSGFWESNGQKKITDNEVLPRVGIPSMYTLLYRYHLHLLGHVCRLDDGHIVKDLL